MKQPTLAAIDLGTNSCRLLIADRSGRTLYKNAISTRLGEGMSAGNRFTDEAVMRGIECFCTFKMTMDEYGTEKYRAIATAACRTAENGAEFAKKIKQQSGIDLEIIDGYEEAVLNLKGALLNVQDEKAGYVVVTIWAAVRPKSRWRPEAPNRRFCIPFPFPGERATRRKNSA